jgi:hypothetical protein
VAAALLRGGAEPARPTPKAVLRADATLVTGHSEKEQACPMLKRGVGYHPIAV